MKNPTIITAIIILLTFTLSSCQQHIKTKLSHQSGLIWETEKIKRKKVIIYLADSIETKSPSTE